MKGGEERVDATVSYDDAEHGTVYVDVHDHEDYNHDEFFTAYAPEAEDGCYCPEGIDNI